MNLSNKKLLIVSHTEHFINSNGNPSGWIPTVREIDFLANYFKEIIHLAVLHEGMAPDSTIEYAAKNVHFVSIPAFGGKGIANKLKILTVIPRLLSLVKKNLRSVDYFQFRAPTSIGLFLIPFFTIFTNKKGWYKYAGSWIQPNMPLSYVLQKRMLVHFQKRTVTINGRWENQKKHIKSFENPCLNKKELEDFDKKTSLKDYSLPIIGCFVGRLDKSKGVDRIIDYLQSNHANSNIKEFHFVGDGPDVESYKEKSQFSDVKVFFHGFLNRQETFDIYAKSHILLLPSDSEGFPKVVAEAAAFGVIPIVSDVGSISQYINSENGFLWNSNIEFTEYMGEINLIKSDMEKRRKELQEIAHKFTFEKYLNDLTQKVFKE